ncbi:MAG: hypothetical protein VXZ82_04450 [Planctomycetota bacterium]|nr:hypothetical protein [Planctomycetota bacterium]
MSGTIDRMPTQIQANAVAWRVNEAFLVGQLNDEGVVWGLFWR